MLRFADFRLESDGLHEDLVIPVPDRCSLQIPVVDDRFHVVGQHVPRNPHVGKGMDHSDEQVLLLRIGEELYVPESVLATT